MLRLFRFLFLGDGHKHKWRFTYVTHFEKDAVSEWVKVCEVCGAHRSGTFYNCSAQTADELNLK